MSPTIEVPWEPSQVAIFAILNAYFSTRVPAIPVYDMVPEDAEPPYIEIGTHRWRASNTKLESGWEGGPEILVWSDKRTLKEAAGLATEAANALSVDGAIAAAIPAGWTGYLMDIEQANAGEVLVGGTVEVRGEIRPRLWLTRD